MPQDDSSRYFDGPFLATLPHHPSDDVFLCGSLVEGLGNEHSDFDVYVVTDAYPRLRDGTFFTGRMCRTLKGEWVFGATLPPDAEVGEVLDLHAVGGRCVHITYMARADIARRFDDIEQRYAGARQDLGDIRDERYDEYGIGDRTMVHKLLAGRRLHAGAWDGRIGFSELAGKYAYLAYRYHNASWDIALDISGAWFSGDMDLCVHFTRRFMEYCAWGFSHLLGFTNTNRKWIVALVKRWPEPHASLARTFMDLYFGDVRTAQRQQDFVAAALDWTDRVFAAGVDVQRSTPQAPPPEEWKAYFLDMFVRIQDPSALQIREYLWSLRLVQKQVPASVELLLARGSENLLSRYR
ncbi:MAG TPA: hypothetical protein VK196_06045 [Magnetospirillum sp.]|nr:hypothetical protein [Magnetospirillum sp.]